MKFTADICECCTGEGLVVLAEYTYNSSERKNIACCEECAQKISALVADGSETFTHLSWISEPVRAPHLNQLPN